MLFDWLSVLQSRVGGWGGKWGGGERGATGWLLSLSQDAD